MKALKRNCKVPFLIAGYFCSESRGDFNGLYFTRALISRGRYRAVGFVPAYIRCSRTRYDHRGYTVTEKRETRNGKRKEEYKIAMDSYI